MVAPAHRHYSTGTVLGTCGHLLRHKHRNLEARLRSRVEGFMSTVVLVLHYVAYIQYRTVVCTIICTEAVVAKATPAAGVNVDD